MNRQRTHADSAFLPRRQFPERANVQFFAEIELASSLLKNILDSLAFLLMFLPVFVLALLVAIPNALAGPALHEGVTFLSARRTHLGRGGPPFRRGFVILSFRRIAERQRTKLLSSLRCTVLFG